MNTSENGQRLGTQTTLQTLGFRPMVIGISQEPHPLCQWVPDNRSTCTWDISLPLFSPPPALSTVNLGTIEGNQMILMNRTNDWQHRPEPFQFILQTQPEFMILKEFTGIPVEPSPLGQDKPFDAAGKPDNPTVEICEVDEVMEKQQKLATSPDNPGPSSTAGKEDDATWTEVILPNPLWSPESSKSPMEIEVEIDKDEDIEELVKISRRYKKTRTPSQPVPEERRDDHYQQIRSANANASRAWRDRQRLLEQRRVETILTQRRRIAELEKETLTLRAKVAELERHVEWMQQMMRIMKGGNKCEKE